MTRPLFREEDGERERRVERYGNLTMQREISIHLDWAISKSWILMLVSIYPSATLALRQRPCSRRRRSDTPLRAQSEDRPRRRLWVPRAVGSRPVAAPHALRRARNWGYEVCCEKQGKAEVLCTEKVIGTFCKGSRKEEGLGDWESNALGRLARRDCLEPKEDWAQRRVK
jgi:hypothetical protein